MWYDVEVHTVLPATLYLHKATLYFHSVVPSVITLMYYVFYVRKLKLCIIFSFPVKSMLVVLFSSSFRFFFLLVCEMFFVFLCDGAGTTADKALSLHKVKLRELWRWVGGCGCPG